MPDGPSTLLSVLPNSWERPLSVTWSQSGSPRYLKTIRWTPFASLPAWWNAPSTSGTTSVGGMRRRPSSRRHSRAGKPTPRSQSPQSSTSTCGGESWTFANLPAAEAHRNASKLGATDVRPSLSQAPQPALTEADPLRTRRPGCHSACHSTWRYSARQEYAVDGSRLSCKQQVGGSSPPASSQNGRSQGYTACLAWPDVIPMSFCSNWNDIRRLGGRTGVEGRLGIFTAQRPITPIDHRGVRLDSTAVSGCLGQAGG